MPRATEKRKRARSKTTWQVIRIWLPPDWLAALRLRAARHGRKINAEIRSALARSLRLCAPGEGPTPAQLAALAVKRQKWQQIAAERKAARQVAQGLVTPPRAAWSD